MPADFSRLPTARLLAELCAGRFAQTAPIDTSRPVAVFDTNILLDFWIWDNDETRPMRERLERGGITAPASRETVEELADVIARPQFGLSPERQAEILAHWAALCTPVVIPEALASPRCRDRDDDKFLHLAIAAGAGWLVSRDKLVLKTARRMLERGVRVVPPARARELG